MKYNNLFLCCLARDSYLTAIPTELPSIMASLHANSWLHSIQQLDESITGPTSYHNYSSSYMNKFSNYIKSQDILHDTL